MFDLFSFYKTITIPMPTKAIIFKVVFTVGCLISSEKMQNQNQFARKLFLHNDVALF